ncbi:hypothetical protein DVA86_18610 [Streptomyces armeniacus]|uniref:Uncharacterized protein n=1 Tax=Streptomyces armeniacus TaxID=83291 RepID=A0A345XRU3_9ACTN|nr:DUF6191 domain-containing protein [Streptomyces armeniacus]AXK34359.1 hypothetical protein DVA86_18610 [Streptomyces armeniacus]
MLGPVDELFNPAAKHADDERERLEHTRVVEGDHGPGCGPVDLESGRILIVPQRQDEAVLPARPRVEGAPEADERRTV